MCRANADCKRFIETVRNMRTPDAVVRLFE